MSNSEGPDIPKLNTEVKTRNRGSTSPHSVGQLLISRIITRCYKNTPFYDKLQTQYRVEYDDEKSVITEAKIYDLTDPYIQQQFNKGYEECRARVIAGDRSDYIKSSTWVFFEKTPNGNSYKFRISHAGMKQIKAISDGAKTFNKLFSS